MVVEHILLHCPKHTEINKDACMRGHPHEQEQRKIEIILFMVLYILKRFVPLPYYLIFCIYLHQFLLKFARVLKSDLNMTSIISYEEHKTLKSSLDPAEIWCHLS